MTASPTPPAPRQTPRQTQRWMKKLGDLPDLRWSKVLSARHKISAGLYEHDDTLDTLLPSLANDVGALLRRDE